MSVKAKVEAVIYATEEPVTLNQLVSLLKDTVLAEMRVEEAARLALNEMIAEGSITDEEGDVSDEATTRQGETTTEGRNSERPSYYDGDRLQGADLTQEQQYQLEKQQLQEVKSRLSRILEELIAEYASDGRGIEIRQIAGGYRMATKAEHHDVVVNFAKSLKPPIRLSLQALETLAVIAYKQPVTVPEISEIRGVDSAGVIATLLDRKLVTTAGRKQVIGRPILYKTTKEFLLRFGLKDLSELPSVEEFQKLGDPQAELFQAPSEAQRSEATGTEVEPVTEASPEIASIANREGGPTASDGEMEPVTQAVPELVSEENREKTAPRPTQKSG
jgi:segregation and condensation protein B